MTIYELAQLATPGPLIYHCHTKGQGLQPRSGCAPTGRTWYWHRDDTGESDIYKEKEANRQCRFDMRFDAHCRNNFMKALEALKNEERICGDARHKGTLRKLIAELEEV